MAEKKEFKLLVRIGNVDIKGDKRLCYALDAVKGVSYPFANAVCQVAGIDKFKKIAVDDRVHKYKIRIRAIGNLNCLPEPVVAAIKEAEDATREHDGYSLNVAVGYGGRAELAEAVRKICERIERGELKPGDVDEQIISSHLYTAGLPDPDLVIRTSGEERLSGFLLWQSAYSELHFCEANWPSFSKADFLRAIRIYQGRERRFGK